METVETRGIDKVAIENRNSSQFLKEATLLWHCQLRRDLHLAVRQTGFIVSDYKNCIGVIEEGLKRNIFGRSLSVSTKPKLVEPQD